jgi:hypothetical protein
MNWTMLPKTLLVGVALGTLGTLGCAGRSNAGDVAMVQDPRCAAVDDSISKYVSEDALPAAQLIGDDAIRLPLSGPADSVSVDFVVLPNGVADTSSVEIIGASDPRLRRTAVTFAARHRFTPAQVSGCNVISRYSLVTRSAGQQ